MLPENIGFGVLAISYIANLMLDEPPFMVNMFEFSGYIICIRLKFMAFSNEDSTHYAD